MKLHIISHCKDLDLLPAALLVLDTIRVGFPDADIIVHPMIDGLSGAEQAKYYGALGLKLTAAKATMVDDSWVLGDPSHDEWISDLVDSEDEPFFICDSDVVFFDRVPAEWSKMGALGGEVQPPFHDPFSGAIHVERFHTALMFINPERVRAAIEEWRAQFPQHELLPLADPFAPIIIPGAFGQDLFYDTCTMLFRMVENRMHWRGEDVFAHLQCGTWAKEAGSVIPGLREIHAAVFADPAKARDLRRVQAEFYERHKV